MYEFQLKLDPHLNKDKVFRYDPPLELKLTKLESVRLNALATPVTLKGIKLSKHIGCESNYLRKTELIELIKLIQLRFDGCLDYQLGKMTICEEKIIREKLMEEIDSCSPGFHDRVQEIILSWSRPKNIPQLLHQVRESLVVKAAVKVTNEVHATNRFFTIANLYGFGVRQRNREDVYLGSLNEQTILNALKQTFETSLTHSNVIQMLCDHLRSALSDCYLDYKEEGYSYGAYDTILTRLNGLLAIDSIPLNLIAEEIFIKEEKEEKGITVSRFVAINWDFIKEFISQQCTDYGLYSHKPNGPQTISDLAFHLQSYPSVEEGYENLSAKEKEIIKTIADFKELLQFLDTGKDVKIALLGKLFLPALIKKSSDFEELFNHLTLEQRSTLRLTLASQFFLIFKDSTEFKLMIKNLNIEGSNRLYVKCQHLSTEYFKDATWINRLLGGLVLEHQKAVCEALAGYLPYFLRNAFDFRLIISNLNSQLKAVIYQACLPFLPELIHTLKDFQNATLYLDSEQKLVLYGKCKPRLFKIIKDMDTFFEMLQCFDKDRTLIVTEMSTPYLSDILKNGAAFEKLFDYFWAEERLLVFNWLLPRLPNIIRGGSDFYATIKSCEKIFSPSRKIAFLEAFRNEKWFLPTLRLTISDRESLKAYIGEAIPEQILNDGENARKNPSILQCIVAYALLKQHEHKASIEEAAYFSKPAWNELKDIAKKLFAKEDVDKLHRREHSVLKSLCNHSLFSRSKSGPGRVYLGDYLLNVKYKCKFGGG